MHVGELLHHLNRVQKHKGNNWTACCPAHKDKNPSLSVSEQAGKILLCCFAGCTAEAVCAALGIKLSDLFEDHNSGSRIAAEYDYRDEKSSLLYQVVRYNPKDFKQRHPNGNGNSKWIWNLDGVRRVLYRLPELLNASSVLIPEGEKDVETARQLGFTATTNSGGAGHWRPEFSEQLKGKDITIIPDADDAGRKHGEDVAQSLEGKALRIRVVELPGTKDLSQWVEHGGTRDQLLELISKAPEWKRPSEHSRSENAGNHVTDSADAWSDPATPDADAAREWPVLAPEAKYGIAGEAIELLEPATESDPIGLLVQFLIGFSNVIGHGPHAMVEATRHALNLFIVLVGITGQGRKGTAWDRVSHLLAGADQEWFRHHIESGMTSGEGVAHAVRDGDGKDDPGVADKRLMVVETEFSSVLKNMGRDGSILSPMCRQAWDSGFLRTLNKKNPVRATGAHISIVGHITPQELLRCFTETEMSNGFGNRFLWLSVKRSQYLPEGGVLNSLNSLNSRLAKVLEFAKTVGLMKRDQQARELWAQVYRSLVDVPPGLVGSLTSRGAPIVLRLSCTYALLDMCSEVKVEHLLAALSVWDYAQQSVRYIFGAALGDPTADQILEALKTAGDEGLTRTELRDLFRRNLTSAEISRALRYLAELNRIEKVMEPTEGRPIERWRLRVTT